MSAKQKRIFNHRCTKLNWYLESLKILTGFPSRHNRSSIGFGILKSVGYGSINCTIVVINWRGLPQWLRDFFRAIECRFRFQQSVQSAATKRGLKHLLFVISILFILFKLSGLPFSLCIPFATIPNAIISCSAHPCLLTCCPILLTKWCSKVSGRDYFSKQPADWKSSKTIDPC